MKKLHSARMSKKITEKKSIAIIHIDLEYIDKPSHQSFNQEEEEMVLDESNNAKTPNRPSIGRSS
jgi:hypothetical protein